MSEIAEAMHDLSKVDHKIARDKIMDFEKLISDQEGAYFGDTVNCPLIHLFSPGMYVRQITIPAGTALTGKIHKHSHPNFLMSGIVEVFTESGGIERLEGPLSMISPPGTKRALIAVTTVVWATVHENPNNTQDLAELEKIVIAGSFEEYERFKKLQHRKEYGVKLLNKVKKFFHLNFDAR